MVPETRGHKLGVASMAVVAVAAFLPWVSVLGLSVSGSTAMVR